MGGGLVPTQEKKKKKLIKLGLKKFVNIGNITMSGNRAQHPVSPPEIKLWHQCYPPLPHYAKQISIFSRPVHFCLSSWYCFINFFCDRTAKVFPRKLKRTFKTLSPSFLPKLFSGMCNFIQSCGYSRVWDSMFKAFKKVLLWVISLRFHIHRGLTWCSSNLVISTLKYIDELWIVRRS